MNILQYSFDCDNDGNFEIGPQSSQDATCTFHDRGSYTVGLRVEDGNHAADSSSFQVTVQDIPPTAVSAGGPYAGRAGEPVALSASATCAPVDTCTFAWDLDNDSTFDDASGNNPSFLRYTAGNYPVAVQVSDGDGSPVSASTSVTVDPAVHDIPLSPGWNLVSFRSLPADTSIAAVLNSMAGHYSLVYAWDGQTQRWHKFDVNAPPYANDLASLSPLQGFWINVTSPGTLSISGNAPDTSSIQLYAAGSGWNLVGYPSRVAHDLPGVLQDHGVGANFGLVYVYKSGAWNLFDPNRSYGNSLTAFDPGWGYWVKAVSADSIWTVSYGP